MKKKMMLLIIVITCISMFGICGFVQSCAIEQQTVCQKIEIPQAGTTYKTVDEYVYVTASSLNIRSGPGTGYAKVGSLSQNSKVHRIAIGSNGWSKIKYNGKTRYVSSQYLKNKKSTTTATTTKQLYVTASSLNVRSGPGTGYKKIGSLFRNKAVEVVGTSNGWSKIKYNGKTAYVSSQYLSSKKSSTNTILSEMKSRGNIGRLKISSVGVNVALFDVSIYNGKKNQKIVDNSDSAAYMSDAVDCYGFILIGDHRHQGFDKMKKSVPNKTTAVIDFGTYTKTYICTKNFKGKNTGSDLVDMKGNSIAGKNQGGLTMYTCNTDKTITITFWREK